MGNGIPLFESLKEEKKGEMRMAYGGVIIKRCRRMLNETDAAAVLADGDYMMLETGSRRTTAERQ